MTSANERAEERLKVLLVEDSLVDAHLIIAILDSEALYQVTLAQDGMRGTLLATEQDWDLIITDLNLPGDSGLDLIRTAKAHHPGVPILTTTGYTAPRYIQSALREGADDVLMKPIERDELLGKLLYLLGTERPSSDRPARTVLAVGAEPGDVELGCGGILYGHREHRQNVVVVILSEEDTPGATDARRAGESLGATVLFRPMAPAHGQDDDGDTSEATPLAEVIAEFSPDTLYAPSVHDLNERRTAAHRLGLLASRPVPNLYCYQTASSTTDFHPNLFVEVDEYLDGKLRLVGTFGQLSKENPAYSAELVRSTARYWGRYDEYGNAEPLEVVRSEL